jgi:hypothetical protein
MLLHRFTRSEGLRLGRAIAEVAPSGGIEVATIQETFDAMAKGTDRNEQILRGAFAKTLFDKGERPSPAQNERSRLFARSACEGATEVLNRA